jgi:glycogen operon protein
VLARGPGFDPNAPIFAEIAADPLLSTRVMIAEPWDIGPGGYQLGAFPAHWLEWNDRYRDQVRRFWRGDGRSGDLATRVAGSADIFTGAASRSVNFVAAHDGFTLADMVAYAGRHNQANGEDNRDGHGDEVSWNHGVEGPSDDPAIRIARIRSVRAARHAVPVARHPDADRRGRVRAQPGRQQQWLCAGQ